MQTSASIPASDATGPSQVDRDSGVDADGRQDGASVPSTGRPLCVQNDVPEGSERASRMTSGGRYPTSATRQEPMIKGPRILYLSDMNPTTIVATQPHAKGGMVRSWACAAVNPSSCTIVGVKS